MSNEMNVTRRDQGQILARAKLGDAALAGAFAGAGLGVPEMRKRTVTKAGSAMWFSPDEVLIFVDDVAGVLAKLQPAMPAASLSHDVTGVRVVFTISGPYVRDVLAKGVPRDLQSVEIGEVVRSRLGQIAVAFWLTDDNTAELVCFRSVGEYVGRWLETAALADGLPVLG